MRAATEREQYDLAERLASLLESMSHSEANAERWWE